MPRKPKFQPEDAPAEAAEATPEPSRDQAPADPGPLPPCPVCGKAITKGGALVLAVVDLTGSLAGGVHAACVARI